jgi:membrane-associated protease RseP (regulator of RpoE activity)
MPSRKAVFDIGVAGPIAGFVAIIPVSITAFLTMKVAPTPEIVENIEATGGLYFSDALFTKLLAYFFNTDLSLSLYPNGFYLAAWMGLLITAMNLVPSGQLDGGHALYAVFGDKIHNWTGKIAFVTMIIISLTGIFVYNSPSGLLFTILLGVMLRLGHPEPLDDSPLDFKRKIIAVLTLLIFILSFVPFPIRSSVSLF